MQKSFSVPWSAIQTILQLEGDVYTPGPAQEGMTELINLLSAAGSPAQDLFEGRDNLDGIEYATISKNNAFAISTRHPEVSSDGTPEDWQTFLIGNVVDLGDHLPEESRYEKQPIFVLSGQIINNGEDFLIRDMICRLPTPPSDEMVNWASPENQDSVKAMLIYGQQALTDIQKKDAPLDLEALESRLYTPQHDVDEKFQDICQPATPSILYIDLCRAFQINNDDHYVHSSFEPKSDELNFLNAIFKALNMPTAEYLGDGYLIEQVTAYEHANDRNQYVTILEYDFPRNDGGATHHFCAIMAKNILDANDNILGCKVYAAFDGMVNEDNFIPTAIRCRLNESDVCYQVYHDNPDAVRAAFWYMDGVFTHILAGEDVGISKLAERLNPENKNATEKALSRIFQRTPEDLGDEISRLQEKPQSRGTPNLELVDGRCFHCPDDPGCPWIEMRPN